MSKASIPVELQAILEDLSIKESDGTRLMSKVRVRAAQQVKDYIDIMLMKLHVRDASNTSLQRTIAQTRLALNSVEHEDDRAKQQQEAGVVV
jgi:collagenase-like PrtC family protease